MLMLLLLTMLMLLLPVGNYHHILKVHRSVQPTRWDIHHIARHLE